MIILSLSLKSVHWLMRYCANSTDEWTHAETWTLLTLAESAKIQSKSIVWDFLKTKRKTLFNSPLCNSQLGILVAGLWFLIKPFLELLIFSTEVKKCFEKTWFLFEFFLLVVYLQSVSAKQVEMMCQMTVLQVRKVITLVNPPSVKVCFKSPWRTQSTKVRQRL